MNSRLRRAIPTKLIAISIIALITLLYTGSSVIYAKRGPKGVTNQPHQFNKFVCGTRADHSLHSKALLLHAENVKRLSNLQLAPSVSANFDDGDVAVLVDDGTLLRPPAANPFDLDGLTLLFTPNASGGYNVDEVTFAFDMNFGDDVQAGDDTNHEFNLTGGFSFPFFGTTWTNIWVRSNGNITFGAIGEPDFYDINDFNLHLPMIAAFFADLDPSADGSVHAKEELTKFTVTWNAVPEFDLNNSNTLQLVLNDDGSFQITYNSIGMVTPSNGFLFVGFNSGRASPSIQEVDFSDEQINGGNNDKLFEFFKPADQLPTLETLAIFKKFYETHDDIYDQIIIMTNFDHSNGISPGAAAFHLSISNSVQGIHVGTFDFAADFGSAGRLKSYLWMDQLNAWPDDPSQRNFGFGVNSFLTILGQEAGHRWLSFLRFDTDTGVSDLLLGRGRAHWSTFLGFELTSTMEGGNNWVEISPNTFENKSIIDYYSNLDQYAIGLRAPEEVPPFFYISSTSNDMLSARSAGTVSPGAQASGTRVEVTIEEVIVAEGPRIPARDSAQKDFHQAFILLVQQETEPSSEEIDKLQLYADEWRDYWNVATDGRSTLSTNLSTELDVAAVEGIVKDVSTNQPIENILAVNLETGVNQTVAAGGYYTWRTLAESVGEPDRSFEQIILAYPYFPDTSEVSISFNTAITQDISLTKLATGSLAGTITNSNSGASVEARVVLHAFSDIIGRFDVEVMTNGSGIYSFADLYVTHPGIIKYEGITVFPDFPGILTEFGELTVEEGAVTTVDIEVDVTDILLVNDDPNGDYSKYFTDVLETLEVTYYPWFTAERGAAPALAAATQTGYPIIIWYTGDEAVNSLSEDEESSLMAFLDAGGRLFLTGQNIVENLSTSSTLLTNYLQVSHGGNSSQALAAAVDDNPVTDGENIFGIAGIGGANNQTSRDILVPTGIAAEALIYGTSGTDVAAVTVDDGNSKIFLAGFGFEALVSGNSNLTPPAQLMFRALTWFDIPDLPSVDVEDEVISSLPKEFSLGQNYPNPFNPETAINYVIPQNASVRLTIYNILGQKIATLVDEQKSSGAYTVNWSGKTNGGNQVASGLYFYRLEARHMTNGNQRIFVDAKKMLLLR